MLVCLLLRPHSTRASQARSPVKRCGATLEHDPDLGPGQRRPEAVVQPPAGTRHAGSGPGRSRSGTARRTPLRPRFADGYQSSSSPPPGSAAHPSSTSPSIAVRRLSVPGRAGPPEDLLHGLGSRDRSALQRAQLATVVDHREQPARDRVAGRLAPGDEQEAEEPRNSSPSESASTSPSSPSRVAWTTAGEHVVGGAAAALLAIRSRRSPAGLPERPRRARRLCPTSCAVAVVEDRRRPREQLVRVLPGAPRGSPRSSGAAAPRRRRRGSRRRRPPPAWRRRSSPPVRPRRNGCSRSHRPWA